MAFTIISINVHSLIPRMHDMYELCLRYKPHILCIQETWLCDTIADHLVSIPNYTVVRADRGGLSGYGGVITYVRTDVAYMSMYDYRDDSYEGIWITVTSTWPHVTVANIYRPPSFNVGPFIDSLEGSVSNMRSFVLVGDFNINTRYTRAFTGFLDRNGLKQWISAPTYFKRNYTSTLDFCITDFASGVGATVGGSVGSDHLPVIVSVDVKTNHGNKHERVTKYIRPMYTKNKNFIEAVHAFCTGFSCERSDSTESANSCWREFLQNFTKITETYYPMKKVTFRHSSKTPLTRDLIDGIKKRTRLYKMAVTTRAKLAWDEYYAYKKKFDSILKHHKSTILKQKLNDSESMKEKWSIIHSAVNSRKAATSQATNILSSDFADAFVQKIDAVVSKFPVSVDNDMVDSYVQRANTRATELAFRWPDITPEDVNGAIIKLKKGAANLESTPVQCVSDCAKDIAPSLTSLIKMSLAACIYPDILKTSKILPVPKGGNANDPANYRPVSIISLFAKIFEIVISKCITDYFVANNLFSCTQHGFIKGRSTVTACADVMEFVYNAIDNRYVTGMVLLDVSNAFPTLSHHILLRKMQHYGFDSNAVKWFSSYLANRLNSVHGANDVTHFTTNGIGVPQGSVLGPLLFNIYVNDLNSAAYKCEIIQYADDTTLLIKTKRGPIAFSRKAEEATAAVLNWFDTNRLAINIRKSKFIVFGNVRNSVSGMRISNQIITKSESVNLLGLRIDSNLQWTSHINYVVARIRVFRLLLFKLRFLIDVPTRILIVKSMVLPVVNLYDFIYDTAPAKSLHFLNTAFNDLMRGILGVRRSCHIKISDLYKLTSLVPLQDVRRSALLKFIENIECGRFHSNIRALMVNATHHYATRAHELFVIPISNSSFGRRRVSVRGFVLRNLAVKH